MLLSITGVRGGIIKYMPKSIAMASSGGWVAHGGTRRRAASAGQQLGARAMRGCAACLPAHSRPAPLHRCQAQAPPPRPLPCCPAVGIGMLLAFTGLRSLGVIVWDSATLVTLGGCPANHRNYLYAFSQPLNASSLASLTPSSLPPYATVYGCVNQNVRGWRGEVRGGPSGCSGAGSVEARRWLRPCPAPPRPPHACLQMRSPTMWLGIAGGFISCLLLYLGVKGSLIIGIA